MFLNKPEDVKEFAKLNFDTQIKLRKYDLIFIFEFSLEKLKEAIYDVIEKDLLNEIGYAFLIYPKKGNRQYINWIHRDDIMPYVGINEDGYVGQSNFKFSGKAKYSSTPPSMVSLMMVV